MRTLKPQIIFYLLGSGKWLSLLGQGPGGSKIARLNDWGQGGLGKRHLDRAIRVNTKCEDLFITCIWPLDNVHSRRGTQQPSGKDDLAFPKRPKRLTVDVSQPLSLATQCVDNGLMNRMAMLAEMEAKYGPNNMGSLTNAHLANATAKCLSWWQHRPILNSGYGIIP